MILRLANAALTSSERCSVEDWLAEAIRSHSARLATSARLASSSLASPPVRLTFPIRSRRARETSSNPWNWEPPAFDVIAQSGIVLSVPTDQYGYRGRSHSLWFCDAREAGQYQWFETAFMVSPLARREASMNPFALDPGADAAKALWNGMAAFQLAWPLEPVDIGDMDEFIDRWARWYGEAAQGHLTQPSQMPERDTPRNWRQK
jgi:hypothetical protein